MITSSNEFHQVMPFSLFHCASTVPQTSRTRALRVILTHSNKTEMAYQVMHNRMMEMGLGVSIAREAVGVILVLEPESEARPSRNNFEVNQGSEKIYMIKNGYAQAAV